MSGKKNVLLIGTGGVGTIVAYGIDYVGKSNLSIVVRRDYKHVAEKGFEIHSCDYGNIKGWKPDNIFPSVEAAASSGTTFDFVIVATKNLPDISKVEELIEPIVNESTTIILMQNGFDLARPLFEKFPKNVVLSGISYIGSHNSNGVISQSQKDRTIISYFENHNLSKEYQIEKAKEFISIYSNEKNNCQYNENAKWSRYSKLVYNATLNTICALTGVDVGRLELSGGLESLAIPAMKEVIKVARADGVDLSDDVINSVCHSDDGDYFEPSMRVDVKKGNPLELEVILGNLLNVARELNVETPILATVYNLLVVVQFRLKEGQNLVSVPPERPITEKTYK